MKWPTKPLTEPGWYWKRHSDEAKNPDNWSIEFLDSNKIKIFLNMRVNKIQFAGPIPEPEEGE